MAKRLLILMILGLLGTAEKSALAANECESLIAVGSKASDDGTRGLIAYLATLLERRLIGDAELARIIDGIERGRIENPILEEQALVSSAAMIHRDAIQEHLQSRHLDRTQLLTWAQENLREKSRIRLRRNETKTVTQEPYQKMEFNPIPPGLFIMGRERKVVRLTHSIEMMSTPVTQKMWVDEMGKNPAVFKKGEHSVVINANGKEIAMQPDNPIETITWWSALAFANRASERAGFKPVYDLSRMKWQAGTSAEAGTLAPYRNWDPTEFRISAQDGDIYKAEGYRLPTEAEIEYVFTNLGRFSGVNPFDVNEPDLENYAWYAMNSKHQTHPVGTTPKTFIVNGNPFYDLFGNVSLWTSDGFSEEMKSGDDPFDIALKMARVCRGGNYASPWILLKPTYRWAEYDSPARSIVGLRLVRTVN